MQSVDDVLKMKAALFVDVDVPRASEDEPWESIVKKVKDHQEHTVLVVDDANKLVGVITDQDILTAVSDPALTEKIANNQLTAREVMNRIDNPLQADTVAQSSEPIGSVIDKLQGANQLKRRFRVLPVISAEGIAIGQVSRESIQASLDDLL
jgi:CBS domain-containing protein